MSEKQIRPSSGYLKKVCVTVLISIVGAVAYRFWPLHQQAPSEITPSIKTGIPMTPPQPGVKPQPDLAIQPNVAAEPHSAPQPGFVRQPTAAPEIIDFDKLGKDNALQARMDKRKQAYGVETGIDMVVKPDETIKVGDTIIPMREIEEQIRLNRGEIVESDIPSQNDGVLTPEDRIRLTDPNNRGEQKEKPSDAKAEEYGVYIVRPGDNIWNIHFRFLNGYFEKKGVAVSPLADEPIKNGVSSGVGKLLKFSENMVYLYNLEQRKLDCDLNKLAPFKRIVIYNMKRVFELLDEIDCQNVDQIHFDGESLWIIRNR